MIKRFVGFLLAIVLVFSLSGCVVPYSKYAALEGEYLALQEEYNTLLASVGDAADVQSAEGVTPTEEYNDSDRAFNEEDVLGLLEITEYSCSNDWWHYYFLVIKNQSEYTVEISAEVSFYNESDELVGAKSNSEEAVGSGMEILLVFMPDEAYTRVEYDISVDEDEYYECVVQDLTYESTSAQDKEIVSVTNNGTEPADFVEVYALFFNGEQVVDYTSHYFTDDDSELKPGKTITKEMDCYEEYTSVCFFFSGRRYR